LRNDYSITPENNTQMAAAAEAEYPEECCGLLFRGPAGSEVVPMPNLQNKLHEENPETYKRDARTAYFIDPQEMEWIGTEKKAGGMELEAIFHSHPDVESYFSETDSEAAAVFGEPTCPGVVYLVYSVVAGKVADLKAFDWSEDETQYAEISLEIAER
jgi:proteasome lid subunit RPN8/RPN11